MMFQDHPDCDTYLSHLAEYLDGELDEADRAALAAHLSDCPPCLTEYERDVLLKALVRRSCACEPAPATLRSQIMTRISIQMTHIEIRSTD